jgi:predicted metal-binding protein
MTLTKRESLEKVFQKHGYVDFKWINPIEFVVSQWVRMKCLYGCDEYGRTATCPPNVPSVPECERFFRDYKDAVVFHFEKKVDKPEERTDWTRELNRKLLELEREIFCSGYEKAFLLFLDSCNFCDGCPGVRSKCKEPEMARPTPEALAMDVFATVRKVGYSINVLSDYDEKMNRFAFLLIK